MPKVLTRIILDSLGPTDDAEAPQYGFMKGRSTSDAIHIVRNAINIIRKQRQKAALVFIDIEKAFDNIDDRALESVLRGHGFSETAIAILKYLWEDEIIMKFQDNSFGSTLVAREESIRVTFYHHSSSYSA